MSEVGSKIRKTFKLRLLVTNYWNIFLYFQDYALNNNDNTETINEGKAKMVMLLDAFMNYEKNKFLSTNLYFCSFFFNHGSRKGDIF